MLKSLLTQKTAEWASAALVLATAGVVGHQAGLGMTLPQVMGGATAILGSVMAAVMVRLWPDDKKIPIRVRIRKDD
jgi:hypothetical protein